MSQYGARPVSLDLQRTRTLSQASPAPGDPLMLPAPVSQPRKRAELVTALEQRAWGEGPHRLVVASVDGGVGRTAVAAGLAAVLARWSSTPGPTLYLDTSWARFSATGDRLGVPVSSTTAAAVRMAIDLSPDATAAESVDRVCASAASGAFALLGAGPGDDPIDAGELRMLVVQWLSAALGHVVVDAAADPVADSLDWGLGVDRVLICRGDEASLRRQHQMLVDLRDRHGVATKQSVVTVVNDHFTGQPTRAAKAASRALESRCRRVVHLGTDKALRGSRPITADTLSATTVAALIKTVLASKVSPTEGNAV